MTTKKIATADIEIGMYVSRLDRPWRETPFLSQGFFVRNTDEIKKLKESSRFAYVMIPDEEYSLQSAHDQPISLATINNLFTASNLKSPASQTSFKNELPSAEKAHAAIENMTMEVWSDLKNGRKLKINDISDRVRMMVDSIERNPDAYTWLCCVKDHPSLEFRHAVNVSALLTIFGRQLGLEHEDLQLLAIGGLCLDVGNFKLPKDLLKKKTRLTDDEWEVMKTHVRHSMQLIKQFTDADTKMQWMVATHHERYDGSGYLAGVSGDHIPLFGQMAGIVDTYVASTEPKPYATAMTSDDSIETLFRQRGHHFKSSLVDHFIQAIGLHPTGSLVEMSSGEIAVVVAQNMHKKLRPRIALVLDALKKPYRDYPLINLATQAHSRDGKSLSIVKGLRAGQYSISLEDILGPLTSHVDEEDFKTDVDFAAQFEQQAVEVDVTSKKSRQPRTGKTDPAQSNQSTTIAKPTTTPKPTTIAKPTTTPKPTTIAKPTTTATSSKVVRFIRAAAAIATVVIGGAFIVYQQSQLEQLAKQLEASRQLAAEKTEEVRLIADAEAKRKAIIEVKEEQAQLLAATEARRKAVEAELKAAVKAKRQAALEAELQAAAQAKRQAALEAELQAAAQAKRQAALEAKRQAAAQAKRQAALETERQAAAQAKRQVVLEAELQAAAQAKRQAALEAELQAAVREKRQAALEAEDQAAAQATRQSALETEYTGTRYARLQTELEAESKIAAEIKRQAELETESADATYKTPQTDLEAEHKAAAEVERHVAPEADLTITAEAKRQEELEAERKATTEAKRQQELGATKPGKVFRDRLEDGSEGPEMVVVPAGSFRMGRLQGRGDNDEKPVRTVTLAKPFSIGRYEVTFNEYDQFARASGRTLPDDKGWGRGRNPVINVSWKDAIAYTHWLSEQTGQSYRLPTETEWEYAARAGSENKYAWGNDIENNRANCDGCRSRWDGKQTAPVGSFQPNRFSLYDTVGNVWEWVEDCWRPNYNGMPTNTSARLHVDGSNCGRRMRRGGSWNDEPIYVRVANRGRGTPEYRNVNLGFRLARDVE